jgi:hypothetical protein
VTGAWTRDEASASGQVFEFRVWAALTEQSRGSLHPFLPLTDRGIDGLVHRLTDSSRRLDHLPDSNYAVSNYLLDPMDPFPEGFTVGDIWSVSDD